MEPNLGMNPYVPGGETPHQWNHSYFARSYAAFFDGSVRLFTTAVAMDAQDRATRFPVGGQRVWISSSPFGHEFFGNVAEDYLVKPGAHDLTTNGIHGRDTLPPP